MSKRVSTKNQTQKQKDAAVYKNQLVQQAQAGNKQAFNQIVLQYEQQIVATVRGMLGDTAEVADVAQQVFINFYKSLTKFRGDANVGTYLTRIAINLSLNEIKRHKRKGNWFSLFKTGKTSDLPPIPDTSQKANKLDNKDLVEKSLQYLEEDLRSVVVLRLMHGYSTKETAEMLQIPLGTVLSRLARGRKKLKDILIRLSG